MSASRFHWTPLTYRSDGPQGSLMIEVQEMVEDSPKQRNHDEAAYLAKGPWNTEQSEENHRAVQQLLTLSRPHRKPLTFRRVHRPDVRSDVF